MDTKSFKRIGVWLDLTSAQIIGHKNGEARLIETVDSPYKRLQREEGEGSDHTRFSANPPFTSNNEYRKNNIKNNEQQEYFKILEKKLAGFEEILLFGPGTAKKQLAKHLAAGKSFSVNRFIIKHTGKLTENQLLAYVRDFYNH